MPDAPSDSDSEDEHRSERSEEIQRLEQLIAQDAVHFGALGEDDVARALESDSAVLGLAADNAAEQKAVNGPQPYRRED
eukprot:5901574-Alexandrium_andersonii.AAC.1